MKLARLARLERATYGLEVRCSIQLSYRRAWRIWNRQAANIREGRYAFNQPKSGLSSTEPRVLPGKDRPQACYRFRRSHRRIVVRTERLCGNFLTCL